MMCVRVCMTTLVPPVLAVVRGLMIMVLYMMLLMRLSPTVGVSRPAPRLLVVGGVAFGSCTHRQMPRTPPPDNHGAHKI
jgi:hypothetical protein